MSLTVFCVYWGDKYHPGYVYALRDAVKKHLTVDHDFKCITTENLPGIHTVKPYVPYHGWWQKIGLFAPRIATGPSLYFDLDVVIKGNIDFLCDYTDTFSAPANWAQSGHGGIQSSVMAWPGNWTYPLDNIEWPQASERFWGDQEFLWDLLGDDWQRMPGVCSYKYHGRSGEPKEPIVVFHGKPDPHEVSDKWILPFTSTLNSHIKSSMGNGCFEGLSATG